MLTLDNKFLAELQDTWVQKLKVFLYQAGCSGNKVGVETEFEIQEDLERVESNFSWIYIPKIDTEHLQNGRLTRTVKADHTGLEKIRYIFTSEEIQERCGCGTSFAFEKKKPKIDLEKLRKMRENFKK
jgi:Fe-S cluster assembly iron-binding protein IscA